VNHRECCKLPKYNNRISQHLFNLVQERTYLAQKMMVVATRYIHFWCAERVQKVHFNFNYFIFAGHLYSQKPHNFCEGTIYFQVCPPKTILFIFQFTRNNRTFIFSAKFACHCTKQELSTRNYSLSKAVYIAISKVFVSNFLLYRILVFM